MAVTIRMNREFTERLKQATAAGIQRATTYLHTQCRLAVNVSNPGRTVKVKRRRPGGNKRTRKVYDSPSAPGQPPRKRTGFGQRHIRMEFDRQARAGRVGVTKNAIYMIYLELGTKRVARRPWLVSTLMKHRDMIGRLAVTSARVAAGK